MARSSWAMSVNPNHKEFVDRFLHSIKGDRSGAGKLRICGHFGMLPLKERPEISISNTYFGLPISDDKHIGLDILLLMRRNLQQDKEQFSSLGEVFAKDSKLCSDLILELEAYLVHGYVGYIADGKGGSVTIAIKRGVKSSDLDHITDEYIAAITKIEPFSEEWRAATKAAWAEIFAGR